MRRSRSERLEHNKGIKPAPRCDDADERSALFVVAVSEIFDVVPFENRFFLPHALHACAHDHCVVSFFVGNHALRECRHNVCKDAILRFYFFSFLLEINNFSEVPA